MHLEMHIFQLNSSLHHQLHFSFYTFQPAFEFLLVTRSYHYRRSGWDHLLFSTIPTCIIYHRYSGLSFSAARQCCPKRRYFISLCSLQRAPSRLMKERVTEATYSTGRNN